MLNEKRAKSQQTMRKLWLEETSTKLIKKMDIFHVRKTRVYLPLYAETFRKKKDRYPSKFAKFRSNSLEFRKIALYLSNNDAYLK